MLSHNGENRGIDLCTPAHRSLHHRCTSILPLWNDRVHTEPCNALQKHTAQVGRWNLTHQPCSTNLTTQQWSQLHSCSCCKVQFKHKCCEVCTAGTLAEPSREARATLALAGGDVQTAVRTAAHATGVPWNFWQCDSVSWINNWVFAQAGFIPQHVAS